MLIHFTQLASLHVLFVLSFLLHYIKLVEDYLQQLGFLHSYLRIVKSCLDNYIVNNSVKMPIKRQEGKLKS